MLQTFVPSGLDNMAPESMLPKSLRETIDLLKTHMYITPGNIQMARERDIADKWERVVLGQYEKDYEQKLKDLTKSPKLSSFDESDELLSNVRALYVSFSYF
jgi:hypothetical protein